MRAKKIFLLSSSYLCSLSLLRMPFSLLMTGVPQADVPVAHAQGPALQGMFLQLIREVDPAVNQRLHDDSRYRPYTLSPLGIEPTPAPSQEGKSTLHHSQEGKSTLHHSQEGRKGGRATTRIPLPGGGRGGFDGFRWPREHLLRRGTPCFVRITLLEDALFPTFSRYFLARPEPTFRLGETDFTVTNVQVTPERGNPWCAFATYAELIARAAQQAGRRITLRFLTPTSFRNGDVDMALPLPRLVFLGYLKRFQEFHPFPFPADAAQQIDRYIGVTRIPALRTDTIRAKGVAIPGFVGEIQFELDPQAPPEFRMAMHLLAEFAYFSGTGRKTTVGMGQTMRMRNEE